MKSMWAKRLLVLVMIFTMVFTASSTFTFADTEYAAADSVWYNGTIYTVDDDFSKVSALAVKGDRLVYVGDDETAKKYIGEDTKVYDLNGQCVLPGLIESHMHAEGTGWMNVSLNVFWLPKETILQKVKEAAEAAEPGEWIRGSGWMNTIWEGDSDFPTKEELDAVAPDNPVYLSRACGHMCWVNSMAIELAGITDDTPNPQGGYIYRDENGEATGVFTDTAMYPISGIIPPKTPEQVRRSYEECAKLLEFLLNSEEGTAIMAAERGIPLSKSALKTCTDGGLLNEVVAEANSKVLEWAKFPLDTQFENSKLKGNPDGVYYDVFGGLSYDEYSVEKAAEILVEGVTEVLEG